MVFEIYCEGPWSTKPGLRRRFIPTCSFIPGRGHAITGYAIGFDRIMEICEIRPKPTGRIVVVSFDDTRKEAIVIANKLREHVCDIS